MRRTRALELALGLDLETLMRLLGADPLGDPAVQKENLRRLADREGLLPLPLESSA